jgi:PPK2 family polyphosphate:nucleotide phosphotransferase
MDLLDRLRVRTGRKVRLSDHDPDATPGYPRKASAREHLEKNLARLSTLQYLLYAEGRRALLIVLQAVDAGGKDGTIRHVMSGLNPQGCRVTSFKVPSAEERAHDFLWRIHKAVPEHGEIGIFNRSHYEDVLVARVHSLVPKSVWSERYEQINAFERILTDNSIVILKFFLHISKEEQRRRLEERVVDPTKNWKLSEQDLAERERWDDYVRAYEDVLGRCSTSWAPWFLIPADRKWYRNLAVSQIIVETMRDLKMEFPRPSIDLSRLKLR